MAVSPPHLLATRAALPSAGDARFGDRAAAGRRLAALLSRFRGGPALALAVSPGGVVVAGELAHALRISLDAFVTREFPVPGWPAAVAGAVSEGGGMCLNAAALRLPGVTTCAIWQGAQRQQAELAGLVRMYRQGRRLDMFPRCPVILVDDGLGSGLAHLAALRALRHYHPHSTAVATPFGAEAALACVERHVDTVVCLEQATNTSRMPWAFGGDDRAERWAYPIDDVEAAALLARLRQGPLHGEHEA